jgi:hypothetical protein
MTASDELRARLAALAALLPRLEAEGAEASFGTWVASAERTAGVLTMPYVDYGELEHAFHAATAGWVRPDIDWMAWGETDDALALRRDPERLARATTEDLAHLLTTLVRGDRFNEGMLLDAFRDGLLARIARRAAALAAEADASA